MIFFVAGLFSAYRALSRVYRKARSRPEYEEVRVVSFCVMLGMVGFCVASAFLNFAYFFYQPAMGGMAIAISRAAEEEFARADRESSQSTAKGQALSARA
jgi:uncharacterized BrkB/YihY/UPF0761 family membrane protein